MDPPPPPFSCKDCTSHRRALVHREANLSFSSWVAPPPAAATDRHPLVGPQSDLSFSSRATPPRRLTRMEEGYGGAAVSRLQRVVVVGGGVAGSLLAKRMQSYADVILIDPKEYFEIPWANMRSKVEPTVAEKSLINHADYLTDGRVITSSAVGVDEKAVITGDGRRVEFDYLIIASGHNIPSPRSRRDRLQQFQEDNVKINNSDSILIIGGGPTGVELAGEIAADHPDKKVTLVQNGPRLLEFIGRKASDKTLDWLKSKNVNVILNQSVDLNSISDVDREFKTSAGEVITADCHFVCVERPLGSSWLKESFLQEFLNGNGRLMVDEYLRVGGQNNIFAIGDITDIHELKQGFIAQKHAEVVAKNLKQLIKSRKKECKMTKYKASSTMAMVSLGRKDAVAQFPFATMIGFLPGYIKTNYLFVSRTRRKMGLD